MKKKIFIASAILIVIILVILGWRSLIGAKNQTAIQTFTLKKTDLLDSVLVSGKVISSNTKNVYSKISNYSVKEVYFKVGDTVKAGDVLAQLDTASLDLDIMQTELNIKNAEVSLKNEDSSNQYNLKNALNNVSSTSLELENLKRDFEQTKDLYESIVISRDEFLKAESALKKAQLSYDNAQASLENIKSKNIVIAKNNIETQKIALEKLKKTIIDAKIIAPIDGTVTMVNAKENSSANGLLFVIEDTENLIVSTAIGEYDISLIKLGQDVIIKTDSTGDKQLMGTISQIAPTAIKDASGSTNSSSNIEFDTEITLNDKDPKIKIGMNVRLTIKLNEKKDIYSVPYDALVTEADGGKFINVLATTQKGSKPQNIPTKIKVQTGMETDTYVQIISPELKDGLNIMINSITAPKNP